jgi:hypothetical protein
MPVPPFALFTSSVLLLHTPDVAQWHTGSLARSVVTVVRFLHRYRSLSARFRVGRNHLTDTHAFFVAHPQGLSTRIACRQNLELRLLVAYWPQRVSLFEAVEQREMTGKGNNRCRQQSLLRA